MMESRSREKALPVLLKLLIVIVIPIVLVLTSVRLLLTTGFVQLQYNIPGFPADPYGFSKEERLRWAKISLEYLLNDEGIEFLSEQELEEGSPLYNERELRHMEDVKDIVEIALRVWMTLLAILFGLVMLMGFLAGWAEAGNALKNGARLTLVIMGILLLGVIIIFPIVFVAFHEIFFDPGTWMFSFQDSLIRLFPQRFWQVAFLAVALLTGIQAAVLFLVGRFLSRSSGLVPE